MRFATARERLGELEAAVGAGAADERRRGPAGRARRVVASRYGQKRILRRDRPFPQEQLPPAVLEQAGHPLDLKRIDPASWIEASKTSHATDYDLMAKVIRHALRNKS